MSLDIYLHRFKGALGVSPVLPLLWGEEMRAAWQNIGNGKPAYTFSEDEDKKYLAARRSIEAAQSDYGLFFDKSSCEQVEAPSGICGTIDNKIGYMQIPYWTGANLSQNTAVKAAHEAFVEVPDRYFGVVVPLWQETSDALQQQIEGFQIFEGRDEKYVLRLRFVLQAVDWVIAQPNTDSYFLIWSA